MSRLLDCSITNDKDLDDCADSSRVGNQDDAVAFIRKKTRAGSDCSELTMRLSNAELLSTSGFFGPTKNSNISAFFGSSIPNLPNDIVERFDVLFSKKVFIPVTTRRYTRDSRILNQYLKNHSSLRWMFISSRFKEKGYVPYHPLSFQTENKIQYAASVILKAFSEKTCQKEQILEAISKTKNLPIPKFDDRFARQNRYEPPPEFPPGKITDSGQLVIQYLNYLVRESEAFDYFRTKKNLLAIYESVLTGAIRNKNLFLARRAEEEYKPVTINIFGGED